MLSDGRKTGTLFQVSLERLLDKSNDLYIMSNKIDWSDFSGSFSKLYCQDNGRPAKPIRLMVGLHYLKYMYNLSDEELVLRWLENPYWQYFCGEKYFQYEAPIDPSSMTRWRNRVDSNDLEVLLTSTIKTALTMGAIRKTDIEKVNVDTTVSEKNITFPTDAKLAYKMILQLGNLAKSFGIKLRQSFVRVGKKSVVMQTRFRRANQHKKANKEITKLRRFLDKLAFDIRSKASQELLVSDEFLMSFDLVERLLGQSRYSKNKIYSLHEQDVECISKGKSHKKYEFGCKVGIVATSRNCFILSSLAFHGVPYDGHTLAQNLSQANSVVEKIGKINDAYVDQGYRKSNYEGDIKINIVKRGWRKLDRSVRKWLGRRSAIEPVIGHLKSDCRLSKNYLKGKNGDRTNAILSAAGYNMRKLIVHIFCSKLKYCIKLDIIAKLLSNFSTKKPIIIFSS